MPNIKCPVSITCGGPTEVDDPRANFSSEAPDVIRFAAVGWAPPPLDPTLPPKAPPTVTDTYFANGCLSLCFSTQSQAAADACAAAEAYLCALVGHDGDTNDRGVGGGPEPDIFYNTIQQCSYVCPDGTTFTTTIPAGTVPALTQFEADHIAHLSACLIASTAFICLGSLTSTTCNGTAYLSSTTAVGGRAPMTFTVVSGALPPGLNLSTGVDGRTLILAGATTTPGVYPFQIAATDANGNTLYKVFTIAVVGVDQDTLAQGTLGVAYSQTLTAANMTIPLAWAVSAGTLPSGLSLNSASGEIHGTPIGSGLSTFAVTVTDDAGLSCSRQLSINVVGMTCPVFEGTFDPALGGNTWIVGINDTAIGRMIVSGILPDKLYNADTLAFIAAIAGATVNGGGGYITTTQKFAVQGGGGFQFINVLTGVVTTTVSPNGNTMPPDYASDEDRVYGVCWTGLPLAHAFITGVQALTELIVSAVDIGIPGGTLGWQVAYCPSPKRLLVPHMTGGETIDLYSLPAGGLLGTINLSAGGFGSFQGGPIYNSVNGHFFAAIEGDTPAFPQRVIEIDPATFAIIHTYDLGESGLGQVMGLDFSRETGEVYVHGRTLLTAINPTSQTIICQVAATTAGGLGVDRFSKRIFTERVGSSLVSHYH